MFTNPDPCGHRDHDRFEVTASPADRMLTPAIPSTLVDLYGPHLMVTVAAIALEATGFPVIERLIAHPCSERHGCVHAGLILDGRVAGDAITTALSLVFGPPDEAPHRNPVPVGPPVDPRLN